MSKSSIAEIPIRDIRNILSDIRCEFKQKGVVYASSTIRPGLTIGRFCYRYTLGNARKREEKHKRSRKPGAAKK